MKKRQKEELALIPEVTKTLKYVRNITNGKKDRTDGQKEAIKRLKRVSKEIHIDNSLESNKTPYKLRSGTDSQLNPK